MIDVEDAWRARRRGRAGRRMRSASWKRNSRPCRYGGGRARRRAGSRRARRPHPGRGAGAGCWACPSDAGAAAYSLSWCRASVTTLTSACDLTKARAGASYRGECVQAAPAAVRAGHRGPRAGRAALLRGPGRLRAGRGLLPGDDARGAARLRPGARSRGDRLVAVLDRGPQGRRRTPGAPALAGARRPISTSWRAPRTRPCATTASGTRCAHFPDKQRSAVTLRLPGRPLARRDRRGHGDDRGRSQAQRVRGPQAPARARRADDGRDQHEHGDDTIASTPLAARIDALPWDELRGQLDERGFAVTAPVLGDDECRDLADLFDGGRFRSTIDMARYRFGDGRYRYFDHPLPAAIGELRERRSTATSLRSRTPGRDSSAATSTPSRSSTRSCSRAAARPARSGRRRSSCATARATGTRSTRISTATSTSRSRC